MKKNCFAKIGIAILSGALVIMTVFPYGHAVAENVTEHPAEEISFEEDQKSGEPDSEEESLSGEEELPVASVSSEEVEELAGELSSKEELSSENEDGEAPVSSEEEEEPAGEPSSKEEPFPEDGDAKAPVSSEEEEEPSSKEEPFSEDEDAEAESSSEEEPSSVELSSEEEEPAAQSSSGEESSSEEPSSEEEEPAAESSSEEEQTSEEPSTEEEEPAEEPSSGEEPSSEEPFTEEEESAEESSSREEPSSEEVSSEEQQTEKSPETTPGKEQEPRPEKPDYTGTQVSGLKAVSGTDGVTLSWDPSEGAFGYIIGSIHNGNLYAQLAWTLKTSYLDSEASLTDYSYYWLFPFQRKDGKNIRGKASPYVFGIRRLPAVAEITAEPADNSVILSWSAVKGAEGYVVKARRGSNGMVRILADLTELSYTDRFARHNEYSFYWVYPYVKGRTAVRPGEISRYVFAKSILVTQEMNGALQKAKSYLQTMSMSRNQLTVRLKNDGYSEAACTYALQKCGADWNAEAVKAAYALLKNYPLSKEGLYKVLTQARSFTEEESRYGCEHVAVDWKEQAVKCVEYDLKNAFSSKENLRKILVKNEFFTEEEAEYGLTHAGVDWKEEALEALRYHMNRDSVSGWDEMHDIMVSKELFTEEEVQYAAKKLGILG